MRSKSETGRVAPPPPLAPVGRVGSLAAPAGRVGQLAAIGGVSRHGQGPLNSASSGRKRYSNEELDGKRNFSFTFHVFLFICMIWFGASRRDTSTYWAGLWIRIHFMRIRIQLFFSMRTGSSCFFNVDPDLDPDPVRFLTHFLMKSFLELKKQTKKIAQK